MTESSAIAFKDVIGTYISTMSDNYKQVFAAYEKMLSRKMHLKIIQVGENHPHAHYIEHKKEDGELLGVNVTIDILNDDITEEELLDLIENYNHDTEIDGISVAWPLPRHLNPAIITQAITPLKDVDGFHMHSECYPCTAFGIVIFLKTIGQEIKGKHVLLMGAGPLVGRPLIKMFINMGAILTTCDENINPKLLQSLLNTAEIIVVSVNKPHLLSKNYIYNPGSIIVDAAIFRDTDGKLKGACDPNLPGVAQTPVPGGVNLLSRLALFMNLAYLYEKRSGAIVTNAEKLKGRFVH